MAKQSNLHRLRRLHRVPLRELEAVSGLSNQYISCAELQKIPATAQMERKLDDAMEALITNRKQKLLLLEADFLKYRGRLLEPAEDGSHE